MQNVLGVKRKNVLIIYFQLICIYKEVCSNYDHYSIVHRHFTKFEHIRKLVKNDWYVKSSVIALTTMTTGEDAEITH